MKPPANSNRLQHGSSAFGAHVWLPTAANRQTAHETNMVSDGEPACLLPTAHSIAVSYHCQHTRLTDSLSHPTIHPYASARTCDAAIGSLSQNEGHMSGAHMTYALIGNMSHRTALSFRSTHANLCESVRYDRPNLCPNTLVQRLGGRHSVHMSSHVTSIS